MPRKLTTEEFIAKAREVHGYRYNYSKVEYINSRTKVCIICKEHGVFKQIAGKHLFGDGCPKCKSKNTGKKCRMSVSLFVEKSKKVHKNKYNYSKVEYINNRSKVCIICQIHGEFWQTPGSHLQGHGCPMCNFDALAKSNKSDSFNFIEKAIKIHGDKYDYSLVNYIGSHKKIQIICKKHGVFEQTPTNHLSGYGCPKCKESHGELKVEEYLKNNKICYKAQYPVKLEQKMFSRNNLKIDFYLPEYNTFVEFNGEQHYKFKKMFHKSKEGFNKQVERDKRLKDYCKENKIKLIVIKYNQIDKIEEILNKRLKIN